MDPESHEYAMGFEVESGTQLCGYGYCIEMVCP